MDKIIIDVETIDWTNGDMASMCLLVTSGSEVSFSWGDGKRNVYIGNGDWMEIHHQYPRCCKEVNPYRIEIVSSIANSIKGFKSGFIDMRVCGIDVSQSPALEELIMDYLQGDLDVSHNPLLKKLDCSWGTFEELYLNKNPLLQTLNCRKCGNLKRLQLSKCVSLEELDIFYCASLKQVGLHNDSRLKFIRFEGTNLNKNVEAFIKVLDMCHDMA